MTKPRNLKIFPPKNAAEFEELCLSLWERILGDKNIQFNGRGGQSQQGVDLFGRRNKGLDWVGVQCKVRTGGILKEDDLVKDIENAKNFNPRLTELVFATTAPRDQKIQEVARRITVQNLKNKYFSVYVYSWDEIESELSKETNLDIYRRFYSNFFIDYENLGISISRILCVTIGVGSTTDTSYEILLGKTPKPEDSNKYLGLDYWKGVNFIANLNGRTMDTFPKSPFPSDLERAFPVKRDAFIISKWLSSLKSIDDLIYDSKDKFIKTITKDELHKYLGSLED